MTIQILAFDQLSLHQLYDLLAIRAEVFVVEQQCNYLDPDQIDKISFHVLAEKDGEIIGTARIIPPNQESNYAKIGRVLVLKKERMNSYGIQLMKEAIEFCFNNFQLDFIKISAQTYLEKFYSDLGFKGTRNYYLEDNIPHEEMIYRK